MTDLSIFRGGSTMVLCHANIFLAGAVADRGASLLDTGRCRRPQVELSVGNRQAEAQATAPRVRARTCTIISLKPGLFCMATCMHCISSSCPAPSECRIRPRSRIRVARSRQFTHTSAPLYVALSLSLTPPRAHAAARARYSLQSCPVVVRSTARGRFGPPPRRLVAEMPSRRICHCPRRCISVRAHKNQIVRPLACPSRISDAHRFILRTTSSSSSS